MSPLSQFFIFKLPLPLFMRTRLAEHADNCSIPYARLVLARLWRRSWSGRHNIRRLEVDHKYAMQLCIPQHVFSPNVTVSDIVKDASALRATSSGRRILYQPDLIFVFLPNSSLRASNG